MNLKNNFMCFPGGKTKAITFSYDDGVIQDIRLAELFNKYGLKGTFNLNSEIMPEKQDKDHVGLLDIPTVYKGHEIAVHTLTHPFLERLPLQRATYEVLQDKINLEKYSGTIVRGMAYPFGTYNDETINILKSCGIKYSRTCIAHRSFKISTDWYNMPSTCHHGDSELFNLAEQFVNGDPTERWTSIEGWLFYVWGHSYEFRTEEDWARMEKFCSMIANKEDTWYATNIEIYDYITAYRSLEYSADMSIVKNPSAIDIWMIRNGKKIKVPSGAQLELE